MIDPEGLDGVRRQHAEARRRETTETLVERAFLATASANDVTYGELLLAAGRMADRLRGDDGSRGRALLGVLCLVLICATVVGVAVVLSR